MHIEHKYEEIVEEYEEETQEPSRRWCIGGRILKMEMLTYL
jgi:hypothetical protein